MSLYPSYYSSTDASAPVLSGQAGALATLLDALLVDGYGTGLTAKAPLGWTREFTASNKRVYRNNPVSGTGYLCRVDDSPAQYAWMRGYETMSDIDTGTNLVPTVIQKANGLLWQKSNSASSSARSWWAIGNERCLYLFVDYTAGGTPDHQVPFFLGDIQSIKPNDQHCFCISNNTLTSYSSGLQKINMFAGQAPEWYDAPTDSNSALYIGRNGAGAAGPKPLYCASVHGRSSTGGVYGEEVGNVNYDIPVQVNGGIVAQRGVLVEGKFLPRGVFPGMHVPFAELPYTNLALISDLGWLPKRFRSGSSGFSVGVVLFDLGVEW